MPVDHNGTGILGQPLARKCCEKLIWPLPATPAMPRISPPFNSSEMCSSLDAVRIVGLQAEIV